MSLRPPSYDYIDTPLGDKTSFTAMINVVPTTSPLPPKPNSDIDMDYELFTQTINLSTLSLTTPLHAEWDFEQQIMSSHDGGYTYIDFNRAHTPESEDSDIRKMFAIYAAPDDENPMFPGIRSSSISQAEEVEMNRYIDFGYDG